ncbi:hypothetical protein [Nocardioides xinjiangensis]|uniref:hypothetical protein n=1 Tax=Nocardioides xinjiangensis TaxID=2817376 RepID=UPI001B304ADC|nr:hypothetical protein [Nocardioides sp. SYSU D00514]
MSDQEQPGPTHRPYGQSDPYGVPPTGGQSPYGQPPSYGQPPTYGQQAYGQQPAGDRRPGTVTAAAWITIVFSALTAILFALVAVVFVVAREDFVTAFEEEMRNGVGASELDVDAESLAGVIVAVLVAFAIWALIALVLAVFVLRRSNVARVLLVISSAVTALFSLIGIASGISVVPLVAALAVIVLLFVGGAGDWFRGPASGGVPAYQGQQHPGTGHHGSGATGSDASPDPYGQDNPYGRDNPYGQDPYGRPPSGGDGPEGSGR